MKEPLLTEEQQEEDATLSTLPQISSPRLDNEATKDDLATSCLETETVQPLYRNPFLWPKKQYPIHFQFCQKEKNLTIMKILKVKRFSYKA